VQWRPFKRLTIKLKLVASADENARILAAPPAIYLGDIADQYVCGRCETLLLTAPRRTGLIKLFIRCRECDALNLYEP
jgi:hypothetical protein